jgi:hypothetical protein
MLYFFHVPSSSQAIKVDPVKTIQGLCKMDRATNVLAQTLFTISNVSNLVITKGRLCFPTALNHRTEFRRIIFPFKTEIC